MNKLFLVLALSLIALTVFSAEWVPAGSQAPGRPVVEVVSSNIDETVVSVTLPGYYRDTKDIGGVSYAYFTVPGCANLMEKGSPSLPFLAFDVAVSPAGEVSVSCDVTGVVSGREERYLPSKGHFTRNIDPSAVPYAFSGVYASDEFFPKNRVLAGEPFIMRSVRGVNVSVRPFAYNPVTGEVSLATRMLVKIRTQGTGGKNVIAGGPSGTIPKDFADIFSRRFVNFGAQSSRYSAISESGKLLIITADAFYDAMLPLCHWKLQKGISTKMVKLSAIGTTADSVKSCIQNEFDTNGVTFILLVGDANEMPYLTGTSGNVVGEASDPRYALLAGDDQYPDAFVSRFPCQTAAEAATMVNRVINYEKTPSSSGEWYRRAFGIAGDDEGGDPSYADYERVNMLKDKLKSPAYNYTVFDEIYHASATASDVAAAVNAGRGLGLYIGHGGETYWVTTGFSVTDVYNLTNADIVPLILDVACVNGKFNRSGDCFGEAWLKAGTPAAPKGALAIYASSTNQSWVPPCDGQSESVDLIVDEDFHSVGAICVNGCMKGMDLWPGSEGEQLYQQWHIFGDASATIFTDTPAEMAVAHSGMLPVGQAAYEVTVAGVEGALCALYDPVSHTLHGSAYTGADGSASITLDPVPAAPAALTLTVTDFNRIPCIGNVDAIVPEGPWLVHSSHIVNDASGNNDQTVNPGETVMMPVSLKNIGVEEGTGITAALSSTSPYVTVTDGSASFADTAVSAITQSDPDHFAFTVSSAAPNGTILPFKIEWSADGGYDGSTAFSVPACTNLAISAVQVTSLSDTTAVVTWTTNNASNSTVSFGTSSPPSQTASDPALTTSHSVTLTGLAECSDYHFSVISSSPCCYTAEDNNGGNYYQFKTYSRIFVYGPDDVESGTGNWTPSGTAGSIFHRDTCKSYSGSYSWKAGSATCPGTYGNNIDTYLTYNASLDLGSSGAGFVLKFREYCETESGYDICHVQASGNGGISWTDLDSYSGSSSGWRQKSYGLEGFSGNNVKVRFWLESDSVYPYEGWYIDDIEISRPRLCEPVLNVESFSFADDCVGTGGGDGDGSIDPGEEATVTVTLRNEGYFGATNVWAEMSSPSPEVTVPDAVADFPDMAIGASGTSLSNHFKARFSQSIPCGTVVPMTLTVHSAEGNWTDTIDLAAGHYVNPVSALVTESFDGSTFPPSGWAEKQVTGTTGDWARSTGTVRPTGGGTHSGAGLAYYRASQTGNTARLYRTAGSLIPSTAVSATVSFWMYHDTGSTNADKISVQVSTNGTTWSAPGGNTFGRYDGSVGWKRHTVDVSSYIGSAIMIGFFGTSALGNYCHIDDVELSYEGAAVCVTNACTPSCVTPSAPAITGISDDDGCLQSGITVSFTAGSPAVSHDLYRDGAVVLSGVTSPVSHDPGDTATHNYKVRAVNGECFTDSGVQGYADGTCSVPPEVAGGDSAGNIQGWSEDKATQSWPTAAGATGYRLYRGTLADLPNLTGVGTDSCTRYDGTGTSVDLSADDPSVVAGSFYWYIVTANNGAGEGIAGAGRTVNSSGACAP